MKRNSRLATLGGGALLVAVSLTLGSQDVTAADHIDGTDAAGDPPVDIADFYAWGDGTNAVLIMTFGGMNPEASYDAETLYTFHIDTNDDGASDNQIYVKFGQNGAGDWGVQFEGVPGADTFSGAVETELTDGNATAQAGLFDDPFFFDFDGFVATSGALGDDGDPADLLFASVATFIASGEFIPEDAFAGFNATGIVIEFPSADLGADVFDCWVTTGRLEGGEATGTTAAGTTTTGA